MSFPTFNFSTTAEDVSAAFAQQIQEKNVLITGISINGIGFEAAGLKLSEEAIKKEFPAASICQLILDLGSLAAVRKATAEVNTYPEPLHFWFTTQPPEAATSNKWPPPTLDVPLHKVAPPETARHPLSVLHPARRADLATVTRPDPTKYTSADAYFQSKAANILFALELMKGAQGRINAYSLHPGEGGNEGGSDRYGTVAAAFDTRLNAKPGAYLVDSVEANDQIAPPCSNPETVEKLWVITEGIIEDVQPQHWASLVVITGYNSERLRLSEEAIKKQVPGANIRQLVLDLSSLAAVRTAAVEVNAYKELFHVAVHNAAAGGGPFQLSVDGFETQMAIAQIGPFL
ncbi:hypothetical protein K438DRAFT_1955285 [Mycena galopus ATCC 62051]|nr:hypothetical protein K438DRAFT_1955285 [Mycena galopus ATCC 62051]